MTVVAGFCVGHGPGLLAWPDRPAPGVAEPVFAAYREAGRRLAEARPDVVVLVTSEHFANFFAVRPSMYLNVGERASGPEEAWLGVERRAVPGHPELALAMLTWSFTAGFDPAHGHDLLLDHGSIVPLELLPVDRDLPVVPVIVNGLVEPMAPVGRYAAWGESLHELFASRFERIAVIGAGGLSHWPGMPEQGRASVTWDRTVLAGLAAGDRSVVRAMPEAGRADAGPGAEELRAWSVAVTATGAGPAEVLHYAVVPEWGGGLAVVDLKAEPA